MVCRRFILPLFMNTMEGILGDLQILLRVSTSRNEEGNYLDRRWVMSPPRRQGILLIAEPSNVA